MLVLRRSSENAVVGGVGERILAAVKINQAKWYSRFVGALGGLSTPLSALGRLRHILRVKQVVNAVSFGRKKFVDLCRFPGFNYQV